MLDIPHHLQLKLFLCVRDYTIFDHTGKGLNKQGVDMQIEQSEKQIEMQKRIEKYILEGLPSDEEDELWVEFLKAPEWLNYMQIEIGIRSLNR